MKRKRIIIGSVLTGIFIIIGIIYINMRNTVKYEIKENNILELGWMPIKMNPSNPTDTFEVSDFVVSDELDKLKVEIEIEDTDLISYHEEEFLSVGRYQGTVSTLTNKNVKTFEFEVKDTTPPKVIDIKDNRIIWGESEIDKEGLLKEVESRFDDISEIVIKVDEESLEAIEFDKLRIYQVDVEAKDIHDNKCDEILSVEVIILDNNLLNEEDTKDKSFEDIQLLIEEKTKEKEE